MGFLHDMGSRELKALLSQYDRTEVTMELRVVQQAGISYWVPTKLWGFKDGQKTELPGAF
jgi:hypothetical protein